MLQVADYPDHFCDCDTCVDMCKHVPCRPLPSEITDMPEDVQARLRVTYLSYEVYGLIPDTADSGAFSRCTFLTDEGKCELHGKCKPFEGRKVPCERKDYPKGNDDVENEMVSSDRLGEIIYEEWASTKGQQVLENWKIKLDSFSVS